MTNKLVFILDHLGFDLPEEGRPLMVQERERKRSTWSLIYILDHLGFSLPEYEAAEVEAARESARKAA